MGYETDQPWTQWVVNELAKLPANRRRDFLFWSSICWFMIPMINLIHPKRVPKDPLLILSHGLQLLVDH